MTNVSTDQHATCKPNYGSEKTSVFQERLCRKCHNFFFPQYPVSAVGEKLQMLVQSKPIFRSVTVLDGELMSKSSIKMCRYISEAERSPQGDIICAILLRTSVRNIPLNQRSVWASSLSPTLPKRESLGKKIRFMRAEHALVRLSILSPITLLQSFAALGRRIRENAH